MSEGSALPDGWVTARIEDVAQPSGSWSPKAHPSDDFWYVDIEALDNARQVITSPKRLKVSEAPSRARVAIQAGDVLFSLVRPYLKNIAIVPESLGGQVASTAYCAVRPSVAVDGKYLYYALVRDTFIESVVTYGNSPPSGHDDEFLLMQVPVAPLAEQRRIVAAIEEQFTRLDAGVAALKRAQAALKRYRAAVLKAAVEGKLTASWRTHHPDVQPASELLADILTERRARWEADLRAKGKDPAKARYEAPQSPHTEGLPELPQGWVWTTVSQVSQFTRYGTSAKTNDEQDGVPILRMGNIQDGALDFTSLKYLPAAHAEFPELLLQPGDLLFNRTNSAELVGKSAVYHGIPAPCSFASYLIGIRFSPGCSSDYVGFALNSAHGREWVASVVVQQVGQANVNGSKLRAFHLPLPPKAEQDAIVAAVEERISVITTLEATIAANLKRAERLRQAILERAFTCRLVPQDPADEPASALLERIRRERGAATNELTRNGPTDGQPAAVAVSQRPLWE